MSERLRFVGLIAAIFAAVPASAQPPRPQTPQPPSAEASEGEDAEEGAGGEDGDVPEGDAPADGEGVSDGLQGEVDGVTPPEETTPGLRLVVIDAAPYGVDPVVGRHISRQMRETGASLGYEVLTGEQSVAAAQRLRMPYPPTPADLWRVTYVAEAQRGAFARVWAHGGRYVIEVTVASLDNTGPYFARGNSGADDLHAVVDRLLREALPPPSIWQGPPDEQPAGGSGESGSATEGASETPEVRETADGLGHLNEDGQREGPRPRMRHWHLVLQTEGAIGTSQDTFYNHLVGVRVDYRVSAEILFGAYVGYANLRGKDGRANNVVTYLQVEDRVRISSGTDITVPLRLGIGYLPFNGPVIRLAAGLNFPLSSDFQLGFDILTPTFWVLPDRTAVSLDVAAELIWRL